MLSNNIKYIKVEGKMRFLLVLFMAIPTLLAATPEENHAEFKWIDCPEDEVNLVACLRVDFPGDKTDDIALLNKVGGEDTILSGFLKNENTKAISVTVYEDHMEVDDKTRLHTQTEQYFNIMIFPLSNSTHLKCHISRSHCIVLMMMDIPCTR